MLKAKPRIFLDARMLFHSGIGTYLQNVLPRLLPNFSWVFLVSHAVKVKWPFAIDEAEHKFQITGIGIYNPVELLLGYQVPQDIDLVWWPHFNIPINLPNKPLFVTVHDVFHLRFSEEFGSLKTFYTQVYFQQIRKLANKVITVSNFSKQEIAQLTEINPIHIEVIYNGVDVERFTKGLNSSNNKSQKTPYILFVGNLKPHKGLSTLLKAFQKVTMLQPEIELVLCGKFDGFITGIKTLEAEIQDLGIAEKVKKTGLLTEQDLVNVYQNAELLVLPSYYEGFGLPPLEAMAANIPVVVSDAASLPEVVSNAAEIFPVGNEDALAEAILKVLGNTEFATHLKRRGKERIKNFAWKQSAQRHLELFYQTIS